MYRRAWAGCFTTSIPAIRTVPLVGRVRVVAIEMVVVLPAPFGPQQAEDLALPQLQVDPVHSHHAQLRLVNLGQRFYLDNQCGSPSGRRKSAYILQINAPQLGIKL